jgi:hypothetical protein
MNITLTEDQKKWILLIGATALIYFVLYKNR